MIEGHEWSGRRFPFLSSRALKSSKNQYTIVVGKNGTGKSRLMRSVVDAELRKPHREIGPRRGSSGFERVICVSATPYDKFPLPAGLGGRSSRYRYLGLRGVGTKSLSVAYLSRVIWSLLDGISKDSSRGLAVTKVLRYLEYRPTFAARFTLNMPDSAIEKHWAEKQRKYPDAKRLTLRLEDHIRHAAGSRALEAAALRSIAEPSRRDVERIARSFNVVRESMRVRHDRLIEAEGFGALRRKGGLEIEFRAGELNVTDAPRKVIPHLLLLLETGFAKLESVQLTKRGSRVPVDISEASSGEQSVLLSLLGLASQISHGALVCIDEPEVCLHPEWQERYMRLLISSFGAYTRCQFLIATHSPQIVAQLNLGSCFVLDMESAQLRRAREVANRSADFQLATVFDAPGRANEYLIRVAITLMASLAKKKVVDEEARERLVFLRHFSARIERDDPVRGLIASLEEMAEAYA